MIPPRRERAVCHSHSVQIWPPTIIAKSSCPRDPYAALRVPAFRWFLVGSFLSLLGLQMQTCAVAWEVYERTGDNFALALVGLVQVVPVMGLFLPAGHVVDRFDRRRILMPALVCVTACSLGLAWNSSSAGDVRLTYVYLFLTGVARAFYQPARASFLPLIVPRERFASAVTWHSGAFQLATVIGPALGGIIVALRHSASAVYVINGLLWLVFCGCLLAIPRPAFVPSVEPVSLRSLLAGLSFVWRTKVILGAITLDMFAVLLGGATALIPVYAKHILLVGPADQGWMRAAPGMGALAMSLLLAHRPPIERAGRALLWPFRPLAR
jgi:MFS family permease